MKSRDRESRAAEIRSAAGTHAQGYSDALVRKGFTREQAESHWLVRKLRRVESTYQTPKEDKS